ncbi:MAG: aromatic acid exporter family protein, partial [Hydrogeniiclostridium sp.]
MKPADRPVGRKLGPGLRVVKTGMAVTLCLLISYALPFGQPLASAIAAVAVMEKSIDFSLRTARDGAAGILIGAVVGLLFSYAGHGNAGLCGIGVIITLYVCVLLKLERGVLLSELTLFSVMLTPPSGFYWQHALTCAADALIGILVALTVNLIVMPHHYAGEVRENYEALCAVAAQALHAARAGAPAPCKELAAQTER